jgi:hypothetical protein
MRSTLTESIHFADLHGVKVEPHFTIFNSLLILLEILHIYWTYLILKVCGLWWHSCCKHTVHSRNHRRSASLAVTYQQRGTGSTNNGLAWST